MKLETLFCFLKYFYAKHVAGTMTKKVNNSLVNKTQNTSLSQMDIQAHLALGEYCLISAPIIDLPNGKTCVPQHFYGYNHSLESVEHLLGKITFDQAFPIFCAEDNQGLFIQVGIIGRENYQKHLPDRAKKIVYGRKWRVEPNLPTSEIIQTVFLALKKTREHEIRELFTLKSEHNESFSTPFNSHHDLPLMAQYAELFDLSMAANAEFDMTIINQTFQRLCFDQTRIECLHMNTRPNGKLLIDIIFHIGNEEQDPQIEFAELHGIECTLILNKACINELLHELMLCLVNLSDRYVEEHFRFNGFARFSRTQNIQAIGEFSINTRKIHDDKLNEEGKRLIQEHNCKVDESRAPKIKLAQQKQRLAPSFQETEKMEGFLPKGLKD